MASCVVINSVRYIASRRGNSVRIFTARSARTAFTAMRRLDADRAVKCVRAQASAASPGSPSVMSSTRPICLRLLGCHDSAGQAQVLAVRASDPLGQHDRRNRREDAERDLRLAELRVAAGKHAVAHTGQFEAAAEALPLHGGEDDDVTVHHVEDQLAQLREHRLDLVRHVLLHGRAE